MAIVRFFNKKNSRNEKGRYTLKRALEYITNPEKTHYWSDGLYVDAENALERMSIVKRFYNKEDGRSYIHFTISFKGKKDKNQLYEFAEAVSYEFSDYQSLFAIHQNTRNYHIHFVINSVSVKNGKKFSQSRLDLEYFKKNISNLERHFGLGGGEVTIYEIDDFEDDMDNVECEDENSGYAPEFNREAFEKYASTIPDFDTLEELICPMIFYDGDKELLEPMIFYKKPMKGEKKQ